MARIEKVKEVLKQVLDKICLDKDQENALYENTKRFIDKLKEVLKKDNINAEIILGGSVAKKTLIKKDEYDIDIFLRFDEKKSDEELNEAVRKIRKVDDIDPLIVKGSRDYLRFKKGKVVFEIIPIVKVSSPGKARNVTDLSIFHVDYIEKCIKKNAKLADEIRLTKAFVYGSGYYGAESYIKGFSGYSIELLICHYNSFVDFVKSIAESKDKLVIDPEKQYKSKKDVLESLNESKLMSPIVLVDPTFKERNALAALSKETFEKFKEYCKNFLKNPKPGFFELKKIDEESLKSSAKKKKMDFVKIKATTNKQEGDIAGSKLLKFYNYLIRELRKYFDLNICEFEYPGGQTAEYYFILKPKKMILHIGPPLDKKQGVEAFKKKHKKTMVKKGKIYSEEKLNINLDKFLKKFKKDENKVMLDMGITKLDLIT